MSTPVKTKIYASDVLDDLLNVQSKRNGALWLMSYLDVFVLVVMLMVSLLSISEFNPPAKTAPIQQAQVSKSANQPITTVERTVDNPKPAAVTAEGTPSPVAQENALNDKIQQLGLQDSVQMTVSQGAAQFDIKEDVLFQSSAAELTDSGKTLLAGLLPLLKETPGLITIEGHTDNRPIKSGKFLSNWELSATRATSVLHYLVSEQLDESRLRATSYADTKPVADNETEAGREKNRRVNIIIQLEN